MKVIEMIRHLPKLLKMISMLRNVISCKPNMIMIISAVMSLLILYIFVKKHHHHDDCDSCSSSSSSCSCSCSGCDSSSSSSSSSSGSTTIQSDDTSTTCGEEEHCESGCRENCPPPYEHQLKEELLCKYKEKCCVTNCYINILVKSHQLCIPQYILRRAECIQYFYNFYIPNISNNTIQSLVMLKDLLQWMTSGVSLSPDILPDMLYPIMFVYKTPCGKVCCGEYLKMFVSTDECGARTVFISKGMDYLNIYEYIYPLLIGCSDCPLIFDLLNGNEYYTYNISESCPVSLLQFLTAFLSLYVLPECLIGQYVQMDLCYCIDTKQQLEYFYEFFNCDCNMGTTVM
jgi:hypothetical protein